MVPQPSSPHADEILQNLWESGLDPADLMRRSIELSRLAASLTAVCEDGQVGSVGLLTYGQGAFAEAASAAWVRYFVSIGAVAIQAAGASMCFSETAGVIGTMCSGMASVVAEAEGIISTLEANRPILEFFSYDVEHLITEVITSAKAQVSALSAAAVGAISAIPSWAGALPVIPPLSPAGIGESADSTAGRLPGQATAPPDMGHGAPAGAGWDGGAGGGGAAQDIKVSPADRIVGEDGGRGGGGPQVQHADMKGINPNPPSPHPAPAVPGTPGANPGVSTPSAPNISPVSPGTAAPNIAPAAAGPPSGMPGQLGGPLAPAELAPAAPAPAFSPAAPPPAVAPAPAPVAPTVPVGAAPAAVVAASAAGTGSAPLGAVGPGVGVGIGAGVGAVGPVVNAPLAAAGPIAAAAASAAGASAGAVVPSVPPVAPPISAMHSAGAVPPPPVSAATAAPHTGVPVAATSAGSPPPGPGPQPPPGGPGQQHGGHPPGVAGVPPAGTPAVRPVITALSGEPPAGVVIGVDGTSPAGLSFLAVPEAGLAAVQSVVESLGREGGIHWAAGVLEAGGLSQLVITSDRGRSWLPCGVFLPGGAVLPWVHEDSARWEGLQDPARVIVEYAATTGGRLTAMASTFSSAPAAASGIPWALVSTGSHTPPSGEVSRFEVGVPEAKREAITAITDPARQRQQALWLAFDADAKAGSSGSASRFGLLMACRADLSRLANPRWLASLPWDRLEAEYQQLCEREQRRRLDVADIPVGELDTGGGPCRALLAQAYALEAALAVRNPDPRQAVEDAAYSWSMLLDLLDADTTAEKPAIAQAG